MFKKLIGIGFLFISNLSFSASYDAECDSCISDNDFRSFAYNYSATNFENQHKIRSFDHKLVIFNHNKGLAKEVRIVGEGYNVAGEPAITTVYFVAIPSQKLAVLASAYGGLYSSVLVSEIEIPTSIADSTYGLVGSSYLQQQTINEYNSRLPILEHLANYIGAVASIAGKVISVNFVIEVNFSDDSIATFKITGINSDGKLTYGFVGGVDADGNVISESKSHYMSGSFNFAVQGESGVQEFLRAAERAGVPIVDSRNSGNVIHVTCAHGICNITTPTNADPV
ncbi:MULTISPECIES: hypothetical protein [unclassified Pseudoalteromonas]|uniref:hypothetical protein n=1 Tax=unclassified Pseudoalteromonas TaxID=194690 RepID=UPI00041EE1DA|nr:MULTISPECIES: hypothetical protein [unclassified Pseudoalteromonas]